jgi:hypothetical protein
MAAWPGSGHWRWQGMQMQSILPLYLLVNTATIIILSDNSLLFTLAQSVASLAAPYLISNLRPLLLLLLLLFLSPQNWWQIYVSNSSTVPTELVEIDFDFGRPVYFELELLLYRRLAILANAEPFIIAKGAASQRRRIFSSGESTEVPPGM